MRTVSIGAQGFEDIRVHNDFYVDKTDFIREWWESRVQVTLITRPGRFGKTLNMDMLNCFFSNRFAGRRELFEGLKIWEDAKYRNMQGTWPVIFSPLQMSGRNPSRRRGSPSSCPFKGSSGHTGGSGKMILRRKSTNMPSLI